MRAIAMALIAEIVVSFIVSSSQNFLMAELERHARNAAICKQFRYPWLLVRQEKGGTHEALGVAALDV